MMEEGRRGSMEKGTILHKVVCETHAIVTERAEARH